tara:strand:+ start:3194 stop:4438 length:1245 start_codon:yes stop_codon:yes gene_type:complete
MKLFVLLIIVFFGCDNNYKNDFKLLEKIFMSMKKDFPEIVSQPDLYRIQIIYTQIDRATNQQPYFTTFEYGVDPNKYFYPASTVKFPSTVLALEKLKTYSSKNIKINKDTYLTIGNGYGEMTKVEEDITSINSKVSIGHYIKKILVISDDDAFNRIYEFLGQEYFNKRMWNIGYNDFRVRHRLSIALSTEENQYTNPFYFYNNLGEMIFNQPMQHSKLKFKISTVDNFIGNGYYKNSKKYDQPMDFTEKNYFRLSDQQKFLRQIIFPDIVNDDKKINLSTSDYYFLYEWMQKLPRESIYPSYNDYSRYSDGYCKFFIFGDTPNKVPENIHIFNSVGWAYGFLIDNAYIIDTENDVEFFLSAVIYINENEILNDDQYQYSKLGLPFLSKLGKNIYNYELNRKKEVKPDFTRFLHN